MKFLALLAAVVVVGCSTSQYTPEQHACLAKLIDQGANVTLPRSESDAGWQRALTFITQYGETPIAESTDNVIRNEAPAGMTQRAYQITRIVAGDSVRFVARQIYTSDRKLATGTYTCECDQAMLLAWYVRTGELACPFLVEHH